MECKLYKSLSELPGYYQKLFDNRFNHNFYSSKLWFDTLYKTTKNTNEELVIIGIEDAEIALGIIFMLESEIKLGPFTIKKLSSLTNVYSVTFSPLISEGEDTRSIILARAVETLLTMTQKWDILELKNIEFNSPFYYELHSQLDKVKYTIQSYFCHKNWYESTKNDNFESYLDKRKSKVKSNHRRRLKKIENELGKPEFFLYSNIDNLDYALQEFKNIYALSWKGEEQHPEFIEEIIKTAAANNNLRLGLYAVNGTTLAAKLTFVTKTTGHMYKTAYDPKYKQYGAGTAINMFMIEHLLNVDNVELLDFGIGNEHYKSDLMDSSRERWGITAYNNKSIFGFLIGKYYTMGQFIKKTQNSLQTFSGKNRSPEKTKEAISVTDNKQNLGSLDQAYELICYDSITHLPAKLKNTLSHIDKTSFFEGPSWLELLEKYALSKNYSVKIFILQDSFNISPLLIYPMLIEKRRTLFGTRTTLLDFSTIYGIKFSPIFLTDNPKKNDLLTCFYAKLKNNVKWDILNIGLLYDRPDNYNNNNCKDDTPFRNHLSACVKNFSLIDNYYHSTNWATHIKEGDFASYLNKLPSKMQNTLLRKRKKLAKEDSVELVIYDNMNGIEKAISDYQKIYQSSWKEEEYSPDFIHNFIRKTAQLNILRLGILYINKKPASFVKMLLCGNRAIIYKLAYSPEFNGFSPGSILLSDMIKHVVENDNVEYIDFGLGNDPYKKDWMNIRTPILGIIIFNKKTLFGLFNAAKHFIGKLLKKFIKTSET